MQYELICTRDGQEYRFTVDPVDALEKARLLLREGYEVVHVLDIGEFDIGRQSA
jgi:hypothetical protein